MKEKIVLKFILSGNEKEFMDFCAKHEGMWKRVDRYQDLNGYYRRCLLLVGTYYEREDHEQIMDEADHREFNIIVM